MHRKLPVAQTIIFTIALFFSAANLALANFTDTPRHEPSRKKHTSIAHKTKPHATTPTPTKSEPTPTNLPKQTPTQSLTQTPTTIAHVSPTMAIATSIPTPTQIQLATTSSSFIGEINKYRQSQGLGPVQESSQTCAFAAIRAQEIAANFSHDGFNTRISSKTLPYSSWSAVTENIAMTSNPQDVVTMWINSPGHAANMRADTPYVCVAQNGNYFAYEGMKP